MKIHIELESTKECREMRVYQPDGTLIPGVKRLRIEDEIATVIGDDWEIKAPFTMEYIVEEIT